MQIVIEVHKTWCCFNDQFIYAAADYCKIGSCTIVTQSHTCMATVAFGIIELGYKNFALHQLPQRLINTYQYEQMI